MSSDAQILANRQNSQLSTGPTSPGGKAKSSLNAVKTGLTGRTVLLPDEDIELYNKNLADFSAHWQPENDRERALVQSLADTEWRILRSLLSNWGSTPWAALSSPMPSRTRRKPSARVSSKPK